MIVECDVSVASAGRDALSAFGENEAPRKMRPAAQQGDRVARLEAVARQRYDRVFTRGAPRGGHGDEGGRICRRCVSLAT